jgi:hypothetical protein
VHEGRIETVRHGERSEAAVVVNDIEASIASGEVDLPEGPGNVINLVERTLNLIGVGLIEKAHHARA